MLTDIVNTYLSVRRAVGFKLHSVEKCLWSYANFATARGDIRVLRKYKALLFHMEHVVYQIDMIKTPSFA